MKKLALVFGFLFLFGCASNLIRKDGAIEFKANTTEIVYHHEGERVNLGNYEVRFSTMPSRANITLNINDKAKKKYLQEALYILLKEVVFDYEYFKKVTK